MKVLLYDDAELQSSDVGLHGLRTYAQNVSMRSRAVTLQLGVCNKL
jgi:hypothetical protein